MVVHELSALRTGENRYSSATATASTHAPPVLSFTPLRMIEAQARLDRAGRAANGHAILVCAPAGTGKTVLVADWVRRRCPTAVRWVGLADLEDARLWSAIAAALDISPNGRTASALNGDTRSALNGGTGSEPNGRTGSVSNGRTGSTSNGRTESASNGHTGSTSNGHTGSAPGGPVAEAAAILSALGDPATGTVLVLDDAHLLTDSPTLAGLEYFLDHAPPALTTVVIGRYDPPVRWHTLQLAGRLTRIAARDLGFDTEHTAAVLAQHDCRLTESELTVFHELTRGWAALVRIGAIHLAAHTRDRATALTALEHGSHAVADFLVDGLLSALEPEVLDFLLATAIPGSFSVDLAETLVGRIAPRALESLLRNNFPLEAATCRGCLWYTYHPMLRAYLLAEIARTAPERAPALHDECARWFVTAGMLPEALQHVLAGSGGSGLNEFVRDHGPRMVFDGDGPGLLSQLDRLGVGADIFVVLLRTIEAIERGDIVHAAALGDLVRARPLPDSVFVTSDLLGPLAGAIRTDADIRAGRFTAEPTRGLPAPTGHPELDCYIALQAASIHLFGPHPRERAEPELRHVLALTEHVGLDRLTMDVLTRLAVAAGLSGSLTLMRERSLRAVAFAESHHLRGTTALVHARSMIALIAYLQADGQQPRTDEIALPTRGVDGSVAPASGQHAQILALLFDSDSAVDPHTLADALCTGMRNLFEEAPLIASTGGLLIQITWALLRVRRSDTAHRLLDQAVTVLGRTPETILAEAALTESRHCSAVTLDLVAPLLDRDDHLHPVPAIQAWLLHASASHRLDRPVAAHEALRRATTLAYTDRLIRPFLDVPGTIELLDRYMGRFGYLDDFVDTIRRHRRADTAQHVPHLTGAEIAVLRQLPSGMTTHDIATDMGISINTVKTHLRGIYHKLGVRTRADAITRARAVGAI